MNSDDFRLAASWQTRCVKRTCVPLVLLVCSLALLSSGCSNDGKVPISGSVTWQGQPIPEGHNASIIFTPTDPSLGPDAIQLDAGGTFRLRASVGSKRVEVFIDRPVGEPDPVMKTQMHEQYIPIRYNEQTELTADVTAGGPNEFHFKLEQQPGDKIAGG